jgi:hypothetical protein
MAGGQCPFSDGERLLVQVDGFSRAVSSGEDHGEVVELAGDLWVLVAEDGALDGEPAA